MGRAVLLYDADCGFCRFAADLVLRLDRAGRLRAVALQDDEAARLLPGRAPEERMSSWHLVLEGGAVRSGGAAVAPLLRMLPGGGPLAALAEALPGPTERAYRLVARHRGRLGRLLGRACAVDPRARRR